MVAAIAERALPGADYPRRRRWVLRGVAWFLIAFGIGSVVPLATDDWLAAHAPLDLSGWGIWGVIPAFLVYQVLGYAWHRALHTVPLLWRVHQTHHASERIDIWSAMRFHPLDVVGWTVIASVTAIGLLGVSLEAALLNAPARQRGGVVRSHQHPNAALARLSRRAPGKPRAAPRPRRAREELRRHPAGRHAAWARSRTRAGFRRRSGSGTGRPTSCRG